MAILDTITGRRIVIFSRGATNESDEDVFEEVRTIRNGGGFASISGRNSFQRAKDYALKFLAAMMKIYAGETK